jgi:preprotein translocase subunit Sss1
MMIAGALLVVIGFIGYALRIDTEPNPKVGPKENSQRDAQ